MRPLALCGWIVLALLSSTSRATPDVAPDAQEWVRFESVDQVELQGTFYPSTRGSKAPCILLLHALRETSQQEGWIELAKDLQKEGYAVLRFDFRGHGESTSVGPGFWSLGYNQLLKSFHPYRLEATISHRDCSRLANYLMLVQDIAAAKRFLDRKNDAEECNSANCILIGAEEGATLGALWLACECQRRQLVPGAAGLLAQAGARTSPDLLCAVWLSMSPTLGRWRVPVPTWLRSPVREAVPMVLLYGEDDVPAARLARYVREEVLHADHLKLTGAKGIQGTKLSGSALLSTSHLRTNAFIQSYLKTVIEDRGLRAWSKRDVEKTLPAFVPFERFLR